MMNNFLNEQLLGDFLRDTFNTDFIHDTAFPGYRFRPDYRNEELKLIVEFDGYRHYSISSQVLSDVKNSKIVQDLGYRSVRIPYFVQMDETAILHYFDKKLPSFNSYQHGFIDSKCMLPCDFCELGVKRFNKEILELPQSLRYSIIQSLRNKIGTNGDPLLVVPPSMLSIFE